MGGRDLCCGQATPKDNHAHRLRNPAEIVVVTEHRREKGEHDRKLTRPARTSRTRTCMPFLSFMLVDFFRMLSPFRPKIDRTGVFFSIMSFFQPTFSSMFSLACFISALRSRTMSDFILYSVRPRPARSRRRMDYIHA